MESRYCSGDGAIALTRFIGSGGFDVSLMYTDTNIDGVPDGANEMIALTVSRSF